MSLHPQRSQARLWRWAAAAGLLLALLAGYWAALQQLDAAPGQDAGRAAAPQPALDRHMPRVY